MERGLATHGGHDGHVVPVGHEAHEGHIVHVGRVAQSAEDRGAQHATRTHQGEERQIVTTHPRKYTTMMRDRGKPHAADGTLWVAEGHRQIRIYNCTPPADEVDPDEAGLPESRSGQRLNFAHLNFSHCVQALAPVV